jgi:hypothetical protein
LNFTLNEAHNQKIAAAPSEALFLANFELFKKRFPQLCAMHSQKTDKARSLMADNSFFSFCEIEIFTSKSGAASAKENGTLLHSAYDPVKEAQTLLDARLKQAQSDEEAFPKPFAARGDGSGESFSFAFYGFGLGYLPAAAAKKFPSARLILIEPDFFRFLLALFTLDLSAVFAAEKCALLLEADIHAAADVLESLSGETKVVFDFSTPKDNALLGKKTDNPRAQYFLSLTRLVNLHAQQKSANARTLESFGSLWLKNSAKNLHVLAACRGVEEFRGATRGMDALIVAAGPTLDSVASHLRRLQERCVIIAVNTALRACLNAGVQPDFIVLTDPQFWAAAHIAGLKAPESILVTEIASYPSVFRFECKEIVLFDSIYPLGAFFGNHALGKGKLASGGSVASTAWDLARLLGANRIFFAALDLGFPQKRTHARGSLFEEACHARSTRKCPAQTQYASALFSAQSFAAKDYEENTLQSDERMTLYSWWFENEFAKEAAKGNAPPSSITARSRALNGTRLTPLERLLELPVILRQKKDSLHSVGRCGGGRLPPTLNFADAKTMLDPAEGGADGQTKCGTGAGGRLPPPCAAVKDTLNGTLSGTLRELRTGLERMAKDAEHASALCKSALQKEDSKANNALKELSALEKRMKEGGFADIVALALPPRKTALEEFARLEKEYSHPQKRALARSMRTYEHIERAALTCLKELREPMISFGTNHRFPSPSLVTL